MIVLTPDQLYRLIEKEQFQQAYWYEGNVINPKDQRFHFHRSQDANWQIILQDAQQLLGQYAGTFTVRLDKRYNGGSEPSTVVRVSSMIMNNGFGHSMQGHGQHTGPQQSRDEMYQSVLKDVEREMAQKKMEMEIEWYKNRLNGFETGGDRLSYLLTMTLEKMLKVKSNTVPMQGVQEAEEIKGSDKKTKKTGKTKANAIKDPERLNKSIQIILKYVGEDLINSMADGFEKDPEGSKKRMEAMKAFI